MTNCKKGALFDLDGVLINTEEQYTSFWGNECRSYYPDRQGLELTIKGQTLDHIIHSVFSDLEPDEKASIVERLDAFEQQMDYPYVPGCLDFLRQLREREVPLAIVTSSNQTKMKAVHDRCPELFTLFDAILTAEDFTRSKPYPDCYLQAARRLCLQPEDCVVFEDSFNGLRAGRAAGMTVVGLTTSNPADQIGELADVVINDYLGQDASSVIKMFIP